MVNKIWGLFIITGIICCLLTGKVEILNQEILNSTKESLDMIIKIFPVMALWLGIMKIASVSGLLKKISTLLSKPLKKMFGLGNAATPFGLKAMKSLQDLNEKKDTASRSMITFLVLNTSGVTIIPTTIISLRMLYGSTNPTEIVLPCIIATVFGTLGGLIIDWMIARRRND